jgi:hypothetical protein
MYMCSAHGVLSKNLTNTCLGALYLQNFPLAQQICKFEITPVEERIYQLRKNWYIAYLVAPHTVPIRCQNGTLRDTHLKEGVQTVFISPGCTATFQHHVVYSDFSMRLLMHYHTRHSARGSFQKGVITALTIMGVVALLTLALIIWCCARHRKKAHRRRQDTEDAQAATQSWFARWMPSWGPWNVYQPPPPSYQVPPTNFTNRAQNPNHEMQDLASALI